MQRKIVNKIIQKSQNYSVSGETIEIEVLLKVAFTAIADDGSSIKTRNKIRIEAKVSTNPRMLNLGLF